MRTKTRCTRIKNKPRRVQVKIITRVFSKDDGRKVVVKDVKVFDSTKKGRTQIEYTVAKSKEGERIKNEIQRAKEIAAHCFPALEDRDTDR